MLQRTLIAAALLSLAACQPPPVTPSPPSTAAASGGASCNRIEPNHAIAAMMRANAAPAASLPALSGGSLAPGLYDLASGEQFDGAPSWEDTRYVSLQVSASAQGPVLNWAQLAGADGATRTDWTARLSDGARATLVFSCGRQGSAPVSFATDAGELHLHMPDPGGVGALDLVFVPRHN